MSEEAKNNGKKKIRRATGIDLEELETKEGTFREKTEGLRGRACKKLPWRN